MEKEDITIAVAITLYSMDKKKTYKTLIQAPVKYETEVNGKPIFDEEIYTYIRKRMNFYFSPENVGRTLIQLYNSYGLLREHGERDLSSKLGTRRIHLDTTAEVEWFNTQPLTQNLKSFDKVSTPETDWLRILDYCPNNPHDTDKMKGEDNINTKEIYEDLIWKVWGKHTDLNATNTYPVFFVDNMNRESHEWKPKQVITATIKGSTKYDAIRKYADGKTQLENLKLIPVDEVKDGDHILLGYLENNACEFHRGELPKESTLTDHHITIKERLEKKRQRY